MIKCDARAFVSNVSLLRSVIPARTPLPVLKGILLQGGAGTIALTGSKITSAIQIEIPAEIEGAIEPVVLPGSKMIDVCDKLPVESDTVITLEFVGTGMKLKYKRSVFTLRTQPPDQFPEFPAKPDGTMTIPVEALKGVLSRTVLAVSTNQTRVMMCGVNLKCTGGRLVAIGTDAKLLVWATAPYDHDFESVIVPSDAVKNILRVFSDGDMWLSVKNNQLVCGQDGKTVSSALIEAKSPDFGPWLARKYTGKFECDKRELLNVIQGALLLSHADYGKVILSAADDTLTIESDLIDVGGAHSQIEAKVQGTMEPTGCNGTYLRRVLSDLDTERLVVSFTDPANVFSVVPLGAENYECVIAPMTVE